MLQSSLCRALVPTRAAGGKVSPLCTFLPIPPIMLPDVSQGQEETPRFPGQAVWAGATAKLLAFQSM